MRLTEEEILEYVRWYYENRTKDQLIDELIETYTTSDDFIECWENQFNEQPNTITLLETLRQRIIIRNSQS